MSSKLRPEELASLAALLAKLNPLDYASPGMKRGALAALGAILEGPDASNDANGEIKRVALAALAVILAGTDASDDANSEMKRGELAALAAILAGPNASDDAIAERFARASLLLSRAEEWLHDQKKREDETDAYVLSIAELADASDPILPWSDPRLHEISGYDKSHSRRSADERGGLLFDAVGKAVGRKFKRAAVEKLRTKFRAGIEESRFRKLWPLLSKWRQGNRTTGSKSTELPDN